MKKYHPKVKKRKRKHGFRKRKQTSGGQRVIVRRSRKGRKRLAV